MDGSQATLLTPAPAVGTDAQEAKRTFNFSLVRQCDMTDEMRSEVLVVFELI